MTEILTHIEDGVMTLTLNRLERKNSITSAMNGAMADAIAQAEQDPAIRVVVVQGHETVFSAGNDIGDFLNQPPAGMDSPVRAGRISRYLRPRTNRSPTNETMLRLSRVSQGVIVKIPGSPHGPSIWPGKNGCG